MTEQNQSKPVQIYQDKDADNYTGKPLEFYTADFAAADPLALAEASKVPYDQKAQRFEFVLLGREIHITWPEAVTTFADSGEEVIPKYKILLLRFALEAKPVASKGGFIAYREVPWGETYLGPFTGRCIIRFSYMFRNATAYSEAAEKLGGTAIDSKADAAYEFEFMPGLYLRLYFWERDEEFEPQAQFLFSDNIASAFTAEDLAHVGDIILGQLKALKS